MILNFLWQKRKVFAFSRKALTIEWSERGRATAVFPWFCVFCLLVCFVQSIRYSLIMPNQGMRNTLAVESREVLA